MTITAVDGTEVAIMADLIVEVTTTIAGTMTDPAGISTGTMTATMTMVTAAS